MAIQGQSPIALSVLPSERDPLRNFKFSVEFVGTRSVADPFANMGFMSVSGIGIQTDMIPYREGGDNTIVRKMPGQSDVSPLTMVGGVFSGQDKNAQYEWFKHVFAVNWGRGNTAFDEDFRCNIIVRVLKHPVTKWGPSGGVTSAAGARSEGRAQTGAAFKFYNCWPASVVYNDLNAGDNSILVTNMTVHHEGFEPVFGNDAKGSLNNI